METATKEVTKTNQEVQKQEHKAENSVAGKFYMPQTDIIESQNAFMVKMDMPGVGKDNVTIKLENNVLEVEGAINPKTYANLRPLYTEYNIGHYTRKFQFSNDLDREQISAKMEDGVLTLTLPKRPEVAPKQIHVN